MFRSHTPILPINGIGTGLVGLSSMSKSTPHDPHGAMRLEFALQHTPPWIASLPAMLSTGSPPTDPQAGLMSLFAGWRVLWTQPTQKSKHYYRAVLYFGSGGMDGHHQEAREGSQQTNQ